MTSSKSPPDHPPATDADGDESHAQFGSTGRSRSWLWPAAGFVAILLAVVVIGRLGQTPTEVVPPEPTAVRPVAVVPERSLTFVASPGRSTAAGLPAYRIGIRSDGQRYDDGIPAVLNGNQVVRVRDAAALPVGSTALVGGWAQTSACMNLGLGSKCPLVLSDAPFLSDATVTLPLTGQAAFVDEQGAQIYQATVQAGDCSTGVAADCLPELNVGDPLWSGDASTNAGPIMPGRLLGDLFVRNLNLDFKPFEESGYCPLNWPYQSYVVSSPTVPRAEWSGLPIRLVVLYSSPQALDSEGTSNRNAAASMTAFDASNRCVSIPGGVNDAAWVVLDNAMVLTGFDDPGIRTQIRDVLEEAASAG
jgi:hypothetical protein